MDENRGDSPTLATLQQIQIQQQQQQDQLNLPPPPPQGLITSNAVAASNATAITAPLSTSLDYESDAELISLSQQNNNLNAKQQRQQKRRRERAQRLQAERDSHARTTTNGITDSNSIGEDSNNSSTGTGTSNCTTASQMLNGVLGSGVASTPGATDCIASLLLNPPNSPDSGLHPPHVAMAQTDSEDESLDEDLLSTSSSSTLLLPSKDTRLQLQRERINAANASTPLRRKIAKSPVLEEEIIDGFAILAFTSYEDLEFAIKVGHKSKEKRLSNLEELTCNYTIEEHCGGGGKISPNKTLIDTGQLHHHLPPQPSLNSQMHLNNRTSIVGGIQITSDKDLKTVREQWNYTNHLHHQNLVNLNNLNNNNNHNIINNTSNSNNNNNNNVNSGSVINNSSVNQQQLQPQQQQQQPQHQNNNNKNQNSNFDIIESNINSSSSNLNLNSVSASSTTTATGSSSTMTAATTTSLTGDHHKIMLPKKDDTSFTVASTISLTAIVTTATVAVSVAPATITSSPSPLLPINKPNSNLSAPTTVNSTNGTHASSRCTPGKGYICDSDNNENKGSDGGSIVSPSTPTQVTNTTPSPTTPRKSSDFPPLASNGQLGSLLENKSAASPVPQQTTATSQIQTAVPIPSTPSPAAAALPPPNLPPPTNYSNLPMQVPSTAISTNLTAISSSSQQAQIKSIGGGVGLGNNKAPVTCTSISSPVPVTGAASTINSTKSTVTTNLAPSVVSAPITTTLANGFSSSNLPPSITTPISSARISPTNLASPQTIPASDLPASKSPAMPPLNGSNILGLPPGLSLPPVAPYKSYVNSPYPSLYAPYNNIHHSPYNLPTAVPSPSASPRTAITPGAEMRRDKSPHIIGDKGRSITPGSSASNSSMGPSPSQHHLHHHLSSSPHHYPPPQQHPGGHGMPHTAISLSNSSSNSSTSLRDHHAQGSSAIPPSVIPRIHSPRGGPSPNRERESFSVSSLSRSSASSSTSSSSSANILGPYSISSTSTTTATIGAIPPYATPIGSRTSSPHIPLAVTSSSPSIGSSQSPYSKPSAVWPVSHASNILHSPATSISNPSQPTPPPLSSSSMQHSTFQPPVFASPMPPPAISTSAMTPSSSSSTPSSSSAPLPFSAESLFQSSNKPASSNPPDHADLLRRELDSRFLDRAGNPGSTGPPPSVGQSAPTLFRQELHHHQHQHTHLHQHQSMGGPTSLPPTVGPPPPPNASPLFAQTLFKKIPDMGMDSPFYRGLSAGLGYPGYSPALMHPSIGGPTPFMPPSHITPIAPKQQPVPAIVDPNNTKPKQPTKHGRWNAMHVTIAWQIHNSKNPDKTGGPGASIGFGPNPSNPVTSEAPGSLSGLTKPTSSDLLRAPGHMFTSSAAAASLGRPHDLPPSAYPPGLARNPYDAAALAASAGFLGGPPGHMGGGMTPFGRYSQFGSFGGLSPFTTRDIPIGTPLHHDPWRSQIPRSVPGYPTSVGPPPPSAGPPGSGGWPSSLKPPSAVERDLEAARRAEAEAEREQREREMREREQREREKQRQREKEERERKEKEERLKREQQEREKERERKERERIANERREMERERERILQQQRLNENSKMAAAAAAARDRSPHRNGMDDIRIKEERKDQHEQQDMMMRASYGHHPSLGHHSYMAAAAAAAASGRPPHGLPPPHGLSQNPHVHPGMGVPPSPLHLSRSMMAGPPLSHLPPGASWVMDPYSYTPMMRYNPMLDVAMRVEEEQRKAAMQHMYAQAAHMRGPTGPPPGPSLGMQSLGVPGGGKQEPQGVPHKLQPGSGPPGSGMPGSNGGGPGGLPVSVDMLKKENEQSSSSSVQGR
ncbi:AUTS2 family protein [Megaselia abdita]